MSNITTLRSILFDTLNELRNSQSTIDLERVKAINETAKNIVDTAKVEVDFLRTTGNHASTGFLADKPKEGSPAGTFPTANGTKTVSEVRPDVTVTHHKMGG